MAALSTIVEQLENLKKKIETAKRDKAQIEGKLEAALERLRTEFQLTDEEEAFAEIQRLQDEDKRLCDEIEADFAKLIKEFTL